MNDVSKYVQDCIDSLSDEIIQLEDDLKIIERTKSNIKKENERLIDNIKEDIEKNNSRIELIKKLKESDKSHYESELKFMENDNIYTTNKLNEIKAEIINIENLNESLDTMSEINFQQAKLKIDQKKSKYSVKINNIKDKSSLNYLMIKSLNESLLLIREDKVTSENSLVNLISQKETIDELMRTFYLFPKEESINESILITFENISKEVNFQFYIYELKILNKDTIIKNLFDYFYEQFNKLIDKTNFSKICEQCLKCLHGEISIDPDDLLHLLTKKLYDYFKNVIENTIHDDNKKFTLDLDKIMIVLKLIFKFTYIHQVMENKHTFITKTLKISKKDIKMKINEILLINLSNQKEIDRLNIKNKNLDKSLEDPIKIKQNNEQEKSNKLMALNIKLQALLSRKNEMEGELDSLRKKFNLQLSQFDLQIKEIEMLNIELIRRKNIDFNALNEKIDQQIFDYKTVILDKKLKIREFLGKLTDNNSQKTSLVNSFLRKINDTLEKSANQDTYNLQKSNSSTNYLKKTDQQISYVNNQQNKFNTDFPRKKNLYSKVKVLSSPNMNQSKSNLKDNVHIKSPLSDKSLELSIDDLEKSQNENMRINGEITSRNSMGFNSYPNINIIQSEFSYPLVQSSLGKSSSTFKIHDLDTQRNERKREILLGNIKKGEYSQIQFLPKENTIQSSQNKSNTTTFNVVTLNKNYDESINNRQSENFKNSVKFKYELCSPEEFSNLEILKPLLEGTICLKRIINKVNTEETFDPFEKVNDKDLFDYFHFKRSFIFCDKTLKKLIFEKIGESKRIVELFFDLIEKVEVPKSMNNIITLHKLYKKLQKQNVDPNTFFQRYKTSNMQFMQINSKLFNENYRNSCLLAKHFLLKLFLTTGVMIELVFVSYCDFKYFSKGLKLILSDKTKLVKYKNKII